MGTPHWPPTPSPRSGPSRELVEWGALMELDAWRSMVAGRPGTSFDTGDGFYLHQYALPTDALNEARVLDGTARPSEVVDRAERFFPAETRRYQLLHPSDRVAEFDGPCRAAGLVRRPDQPVLVLRRDRLVDAPTPAGYRGAAVEGPGAFRVFEETFCAANELPKVGYWETSQLLRDDAWSFWVGRWDGVPVASAVSYTSRSVTGLWGIATLPSHRHRGIGWALTSEMAKTAFAQGSQGVYLWATPLGFPLYLRMGFEHIENHVVWLRDRTVGRTYAPKPERLMGRRRG